MPCSPAEFTSARSRFPHSRLGLAVVLLLCCACGDRQVTRTSDIRDEIAALPVLYMTEAGERKQAPPPPADQQCYVENGEIYWRAMTCTNPDCPEATTSGEPFLFVTPDPRLTLEGEEVVERNFATGEDLYGFLREEGILWPPVCPACSRQFDLPNVDQEELATYQVLIEPYELPETVAERERLNAELNEVLEGYRKRTGG